MLHKQRGFSLLELCIYLGISQLFLLMASQWISMQYAQLQRLHKHHEQMLCLYAACNALARDIQRGHSQQLWIEHDDGYVWQAGEQYVGWRCKAGRLIRVCGNFDERTRQWHDPVQCLIARGVKEFKLSFDRDHAGIVAVATRLTLSGLELTIQTQERHHYLIQGRAV